MILSLLLEKYTLRFYPSAKSGESQILNGKVTTKNVSTCIWQPTLEEEHGCFTFGRSKTEPARFAKRRLPG
jgi:hypothetical protein